MKKLEFVHVRKCLCGQQWLLGSKCPRCNMEYRWKLNG